MFFLLITLSTIIDNAITNLLFLATKRTIWVNPYIETLK